MSARIRGQIVRRSRIIPPQPRTLFRLGKGPDGRQHVGRKPSVALRVIISLVLVLLVTASGTLASYLYDEGAPFAARLCAGACIGITALGLVGFAFALFLGLTPFAILVTLAVIILLPLVVLNQPARRTVIRQDLLANYRAIRNGLKHPRRLPLGYIAFYAIVAVILWLAFGRAMIELPEGIFTGVLNNFGDLPFHVSVISSFAFGNNYPPEDPTYAGVRFTYPFLTDFVSAIFVRCGASLRQSMFIENFVVALAFVGLMHRWGLVMLRDKLAAIMTPLLVLLNGGFGWILLWDRLRQNGRAGMKAVLESLPPSFTVIPDTSWRWGNTMSTLLIPQRGFLLGLPLAVIVFTQWWLSENVGEKGNGEQGKRGKGKGKKQKKRGADRAQRDQAQVDHATGDRAHATSSKRSSLFPFPLFPSSPVSLSVRRMIAAGIVAGFLPLVHAHSFVVVMVVGGCIALALYGRAWLAVLLALIFAVPLVNAMSSGTLTPFAGKALLLAVAAGLAVGIWFLLPPERRVVWYSFFVAALLVALPQLWWSTHSSAVNAGSFFAFEFGWDSAKESFDFTLAGSQLFGEMPQLRSVIERAAEVFWFWLRNTFFWFWLRNTGLFIPATIAAILWRDELGRLAPRRLLLFLAPFSLCFLIPNVLKMAPWIWDNIKVLFYWWLAAAPLVALLIARLWRQGAMQKTIAAALFVCLTLAGALDVAGIVLRSSANPPTDQQPCDDLQAFLSSPCDCWPRSRYEVFSPAGVEFAELIKQQTDPRAVIVHAPVHNHPVFLTGRRSLMGYPGHVWTHGLEFAPREAEIRRVYAGAPDAAAILRKYRVAYIVVSPLERNVLSVNELFLSNFQLVGEVGGYRLYKITQK